MKQIILLCSGVFCMLAGTTLADEPNMVPRCFNAWSSGYWVGWHHVELVGDTLLYSVNPGAATDAGAPEKIKPSLASWEKFRRELDAIDVWCWQPEYATAGILDATAWGFQIEYLDRALDTGGDGGRYPEKDGTPGFRRSRTSYEQYGRYRKALEALLGIDEFP